MTNLLPIQLSAKIDPQPLVIKLNKSAEKAEQFENQRVLFEFSAKTKNLISFKHRFLKICENSILIYKVSIF